MKKKLLTFILVLCLLLSSCSSNKESSEEFQENTPVVEDTDKAKNVGEFLGIYRDKKVYLSKDENSLVSNTGLPIDFFRDKYEEKIIPSNYVTQVIALGLTIGDSIDQIREKLNYAVPIIDKNILNSGFSFYSFYGEEDLSHIGVLVNEKTISVFNEEDSYEKGKMESDLRDKRRLSLKNNKTNIEYAYVLYYSNFEPIDTNITKKKIKSFKKGLNIDEVVENLGQQPTLSYVQYSDDCNFKMKATYSWTQDAKYMDENNTVYIGFDGDFLSESIVFPNISVFNDDESVNIADDSLSEEKVEKWVNKVLKHRSSDPGWTHIKEYPYQLETYTSPKDGLIYTEVFQDAEDEFVAHRLATFRVDKHGQLQEYSVTDDVYVTISTKYLDPGIIPKFY